MMCVVSIQLEYKQQFGHCDVPQNYAPNPSLGIWVNKVSVIPFLNSCLHIIDQDTRTTYNAHLLSIDASATHGAQESSSSLNDGRLARLQSIGFRWGKRKGQASWEEKLVSLPAVHVNDAYTYTFPFV